jgi:hypothetical protein
MRKGVALLGAVAVVCVSSSASADPKAAADGVYTMPVITVYGRAPKPLVVIEITRPTAAHEAGTAHQRLRDELAAELVPAALRPQPNAR